MSIEEFFNKCAHFDWFYQYSDDHRVWKSGQVAERVLINESNGNPVKKKILEDWSVWIHDRKDDPPKLENYL